jgi:hypothetical protein
MHRNENKYDQLFRDRLGDHSHPVRPDLWSRIDSGIRNLKPVRAPRYDFFSAARQYFGFSTAAITTVAAAVLGITVGIIYFNHEAVPSSTQHYSTTAPAKTGEGAANQGAGTEGRDDAGEKKGEKMTEKKGEEKTSEGGVVAAVKNGEEGEKREGVGVNKREVAGAVMRDKRVMGGKGTEATSRGETEMRKKRGEKKIKESEEREVAGAAAREKKGEGREAQDVKGGGGRGEKITGVVTLPAIAGVSSRAAISARPPVARFRQNGVSGLNSVGSAKMDKTAKTDKIAKTGKTPHQGLGYISLYASPDFPNHYYTWSYTAGLRLTWNFRPRWSFTAGLEYARVNVPTQAVPPTNDILNAFYFSNYEVPILFGYRKTFSRSELTINGGAIANLYAHKSTSNYVWNWPNRDSYSAVLGVDYSYFLGTHLGVFAEPYSRFSISDYRMIIPAQRLSFGVLLGVRYRM